MPKNPSTDGGHSIKATVQVVLFQENDIWISYCPALDLSSYGEDEGDARNSFEQTLKIFIEEMSRKGTLERHLLKLGWILQQKPRPIYHQPIVSQRENKKLLQRKPSIYNEKIRIPVT